MTSASTSLTSTYRMRSALYRCPGLLKQARCRQGSLSVRPPSHARSWSNETGASQAADARFPLYRPSDEPSSPSKASRRLSYTEMPSDRKIRQSVKAQMTAKAIEGLPELLEDELRDFYAAVMNSGKEDTGSRPRIAPPAQPTSRVSSLSVEEKRRMVDAMAGRLLSPSDHAGPSILPAQTDDNHEMVRKVVAKLRDLTAEQEGDAPARVSLGLVSATEWEVLLDETANQGSALEAEKVLSLMGSHGAPPSRDQLTRVMGLFADEGRPTDIARLHDSMRSGTAHDLLIKAHLTCLPAQTITAINLLSSLASNGTPMPQSSYHVLLTYLTASPSLAHDRALARDLFANMRLAAHPTPTPEVYSTMISACADSRDPQPERARDLWIEMTESGLRPERREYDAIIRALSSTKKTYLEAFDLLRQMLAKHAEETFVPFDESDQNVERWSRYVPTAETFKALLEGTKRAGDLNRARWVLNEMVRLHASGLGRGWKGPDADLLSGVFMTYASWKPVVRRTGVKEAVKRREADVKDDLQDTDASASALASATDSLPTQPSSSPGAIDLEQTLGVDKMEAQEGISAGTNETPYNAPLSSADALREADMLFDRILADNASPSEGGPFAQVRLTTRLINSYLSIHLAHAPSISAARKVWDRTWITCKNRDVHPNAWSAMHVLERCAAGDLSSDRQAAVRWADKVWAQYSTFAQAYSLDFASLSALPPPASLESVRQELHLLGLGPRQLERSFRAMIRLKALSPANPVTESLALLDRFHTLFPPSSILQTYTPTTRVPFQIRMTDPTSAPESDIPPVMLWPDVDVLHQRLVREGRRKDIGWLTWLCKSYEVNIRKRRRWRLKRRGERADRHTPPDSSLSSGPQAPSIPDQGTGATGDLSGGQGVDEPPHASEGLDEQPR